MLSSTQRDINFVLRRHPDEKVAKNLEREYLRTSKMLKVYHMKKFLSKKLAYVEEKEAREEKKPALCVCCTAWCAVCSVSCVLCTVHCAAADSSAYVFVPLSFFLSILPLRYGNFHDFQIICFQNQNASMSQVCVSMSL